MKLSLFVAETRDPAEAVERIVEAERRGFYGAWVPQIMGVDALTVLAVAATRTERILLGTSVVPTWPRHPVVMAQQALTVSALSGGRFRLGIGPSHVPLIEGMYGIRFEKPVRHMREYVSIVKSLARAGSVSHQGEQYRVTIGLELRDERLPVMMSVLSEQMSRTAGAVADGAITWLAPPSYLASTVVPLVRAGAEAAGREPPPVIAQMPVTLSSDADAVHRVVRRVLGIYPTLPFYNTMMQKAGLPGAAEALSSGWTPELIDAVIPYGDEAALRARVEQYYEAGAAEVVLSPFPTGGNWSASLTATLDALANLASS